MVATLAEHPISLFSGACTNKRPHETLYSIYYIQIAHGAYIRLYVLALLVCFRLREHLFLGDVLVYRPPDIPVIKYIREALPVPVGQIYIVIAINHQVARGCLPILRCRVEVFNTDTGVGYGAARPHPYQKWSRQGQEASGYIPHQVHVFGARSRP